MSKFVHRLLYYNVLLFFSLYSNTCSGVVADNPSLNACWRYWLGNPFPLPSSFPEDYCCETPGLVDADDAGGASSTFHLDEVDVFSGRRELGHCHGYLLPLRGWGDFRMWIRSGQTQGCQIWPPSRKAHFLKDLGLGFRATFDCNFGKLAVPVPLGCYWPTF